MRSRVMPVLAAVLAIAAFTGLEAADKRKAAGEFRKQIADDQKVLHALNRLTFGPRPFDPAEVKKVGLKRWIDRQLHPEQIEENLLLVEKLKYMDTLRMSSVELVRNYPTPQMAKQMIDGRIPFPSDPGRRLRDRDPAISSRRFRGS